ncbi:MAG: nucleotidyltransferase family protein [Acidobacteriota bacterium]|nr:nucleotidyltransferase family protein [Acidobacteriota bacterium]
MRGAASTEGADRSRAGDRGARLLAAITAAGESHRMGRPKALLEWGDTTLLGAMVRTVRDAGLPAPAVVIGAHRVEVLAEVLDAGALPLENPAYADGRLGSVAVAARWALRQTVRPAALMLWPVDCPAVSDDTLFRMGREASSYPDADVVPRYGGRGGHPVILCHATLSSIIDAPPDGNLRELMGRAAGGRRTIEVPDPAVLDNLNTPADYAAFLNRAATRERARSEHG